MRNRPNDGQPVCIPAGIRFMERGVSKREGEAINGRAFSTCGLQTTLISDDGRYMVCDWRLLGEPQRLATKDFGNGCESLIGLKVTAESADARTGTRVGRVLNQEDLGEKLRLLIAFHKMPEPEWREFPVENGELKGCLVHL